MSIITGEITRDGAIICVLVGVSKNREKRLTSNHLPVPPRIAVRAEIDTGSFWTVFKPSVFRDLGIGPVGHVKIRTPSTKPGDPCETSQFDVSVQLVSGMTIKHIPSVLVIASEDFHEDEPAQALIGRDILNLCVFTYGGPHKEFNLAFTG